MRSAKPPGARRGFGRYLAFLALLIVGPFTLVWLISAAEVRSARNGWAEAGESMGAFRARFPTRPSSPAALELDRRARALGFPLAPESDSSEPTAVLDPLLDALVTSPGWNPWESREASLPPFSDDSLAWLASHRSTLERIEELLLAEAPVVWAVNVDRGQSVVPPIQGQRLLHALLLARARAAAQEGRQEAVGRSLEAVWRHSESLGDSPELVSKLVAVALGHDRNAALQGLPDVPEAWISRLEEPRFVPGLHEAYQREAWTYLKIAVEGWGATDLGAMASGQRPEVGTRGRVGRFLTAPFVSLLMTGTASAILDVSLRVRDEPCDGDLDTWADDLVADIPFWNPLARMTLGSNIRAWRSMKIADLDRERTRQALEARRARRESGRWPDRSVPSLVCEGVAWLHELRDDGSLDIRASAPPLPILDASPEGWSLHLR